VPVRPAPAVTLALAAALALGLACAAPRGPAAGLPGRSEADARAALDRFASAALDGRWPDAYALLSARWRAATTAARLAVDWQGALPAAREAAERVRARLDAGATLAGEGGRRTLALGEGREAVVVLEEEGWRVDALE
jgi:hypothetical protein